MGGTLRSPNLKKSEYAVLFLAPKLHDKKSDALVGRVSILNILETCELAIFSRNLPQISKTYKSENHTLKDSWILFFLS
jgi:hypothetical protein